jgi:hypothetical protein
LKRVLAFATLALGIAGCALVLDLGDRPSLRAERADTGPSDTGPVDAGPVQACGLERSLNETCAQCIEANCCAPSQACGADPDCQDAFECIKDCMGQLSCLSICIAKNANAAALAACSSRSCNICSPQADCQLLGLCGQSYGDSGAEGVFRNVIRGDVLTLDEVNCKARLDAIRRERRDAAACQ